MTQVTAYDVNSPAAKGYETPAFDVLRPRYQTFILAFLKHGDEHQAALECGYSVKSARIQGFHIARLPQVVEALEELTARRMNAAEFSRAAVIHRLQAESNVAMADLCEEVLIDGGNGQKSRKWKPKPIDKVAVQWQQCTGLIVVSREGHAQLNTSAQSKARELLAKYMKWDKELADTAPPISYDFGDLKDNSKD